MSYITVILKTNSNTLSECVNELHSVLQDSDYLTMINMSTSDKLDNPDSIICGVKFTKAEMEKLKNMLDDDSSTSNSFENNQKQKKKL